MLSDPLIVEAIETLFIPTCVYNNSDGDADEAVRKAFEEPAWNYPVVRMITAEREDLVPRIVDRWTATALLDGMVAALEAAEAEVPTWLATLDDEYRARERGVDTAIFGMP